MTEPKVALATTTINVPVNLKLMHEYGPQVAIFVAGDRKTPEQQAADLVNQLGPDAHYLSVETQKSLGYACSEPIGWNCIQRRNIAILEALKWGADIVVVWDDDNIPLDASYFDRFVSVLHHRFSGVCAMSFTGWFDPGQLLVPPARHRGFPLVQKPIWRADAVTGVKVAVAAGACLGDPDVDAITRIVNAPTVYGVSSLMDAGFVVDQSTTYTVFNSQNTAFIRQIAPAMFLLPGVGRYDDIFASLIAQRIMRERSQYVHHGHPAIWQERNKHNALADLQSEMLGMAHVKEFAEWLLCRPFNRTPAGRDSNANLRRIYEDMDQLVWMPKQSIDAALAWLQDVEKVMG